MTELSHDGSPFLSVEEHGDPGAFVKSHHSNPSVLLADDDPIILTLVETWLTDAGYTVYVARNGNEAIALYKAHHPKLIVLDMIMPEKEGLQTIIDLRKEDPAVVIIAISAKAELGGVNFLNIAQQMGARHTMTKPLDRLRLLSVINEELERPMSE